MSVSIASSFDSGAITLVDASDPSRIRLRFRDDNAGDFRQWFHFRISGAKGLALGLTFENAAETSYPGGWEGYKLVASYDRQHWFRLPDTRFDGQALNVSLKPERDAIWLAYFEPYSEERHCERLGLAANHPGVELFSLGQSVEGREIDCLRFGEAAAGKPNVWIIARQHPGEAMAEWFTEGLIERLIDDADPVARRVREKACLWVVPNVNPDGAFHGNLRSNAVGANLNREWFAPDARRSPEILAVRRAMEASGVDLFLDIHGDETLPWVFIDGSQMVPGYGDSNRALQEAFLVGLERASPDFQRRHGYAEDRFGEEMLTLGSKWTAHRFGCVALTLEMPFKDNEAAPDPVHGWNGARSQRLGEAMLLPVLAHLEAL
jgi:murein tripeptide amidase MpaA